MNKYLPLGKFSFGMGDRFGHQGRAQLRACILATELGTAVIPVWNKSNREHTLIGTEPSGLRAEADDAVKALHWKKSYHVDADHIRFETVDKFIPSSDFFTIDVVDSIGKPADNVSVIPN
jgi:tagaturonate epimerase